MSKKKNFKYAPINLVRNIYDANLNKSSIFTNLKNFSDFEYKCEVADKLNPIFSSYVFGEPLPKDISELGKVTFITESPNLLDEINWSLLSLRNHKDNINKFIMLKSQFETSMMIGDYKAAELQLDTIDAEICSSLWAVENRMLLEQLQGGLEKNKAYLTKINEKHKNFILVLADFYSKRAESELLVSRYSQEVKSYVSKWTLKHGAKNSDYYYFKISYFDCDRFDHLEFINAVDFRNSIIDRYLTLIKVIQTKINQGLEDNDIDYLKSRVQYIAKKIKDPLVDNLVKYFNPSEAVVTTRVQDSAIEILDLYTKGDYAEVIFQAGKFLRQNPQNLEIYILYCKSFINRNRELSFPSNAPNLQNSIIRELYNLFEKKLDPHISSLNLRKIAYQLSSFSISAQIMDQVSVETMSDSRFGLLALLNTKLVNPKGYLMYASKGHGNEFLKQLSLDYGKKSITIDLWSSILNVHLDDLLKLGITHQRKLRFQAQLLQTAGLFEQAIVIYEAFLEDKNIPAQVKEESIINLFTCYHKNGDFNNGIRLYVDTFFNNQYFILRLDPSEMLMRIRKARFIGFEIGVNLPLFFYIAGAEEVRVSTALESYLNSFQINRPAMLIPKLSQITDALELLKIHFLLDQVCSIDLFRHLVPIKTTKEKLNERLKIVEYMIGANYSFKPRDFIAEKDEITRQIFIQDGLQEYDESKIYINEKMIKTTLLRELQIEFDRYLSYKKLMRSTKLNFLLLNTDTNSFQSVTYQGKEKDETEGKFSADPLYDLVKAMFLEIRNLFINSQYGLSEYLSARIRHGVFKSEIRPKFEKLNLITERNSKTKVYKANSYWLDKLQFLSPEHMDLINSSLLKFSKLIDELIEEEGLKKYLQIKTEDANSEGWFNYIFDDDILSYYHSILLLKHKHFPDFVDEIFGILWQRTDDNLAAIRQKFTSEFKVKFEEAISTLERELLQIIDKSMCHELFENIVTSKVNIQNDMNRIARWFNRIGKQIKEFRIDRIVEISLEHINKRYDKKEIKLTREIDCEALIKGDLSPSFIDLICGFFDNTLKYCGTEQGKVDTNVRITTSENFLNLSISNHLYGDVNAVMEEFESYKIDQAQSSSEGRSGLKKAKRTITSDFGDSKNVLKFWIDQENTTFNIECNINLDKIRHEGINN